MSGPRPRVLVYMDQRLLEGSDAPLPKAVGIWWCGGAGFVMGTSALVTILASEPFAPNGPLGLLAVGLAPGLLSAAAAWLGTRPEGIVTTVVISLLASIAVSLFCAPFTWILLALTGGQTGVGMTGTGDGAIGMLALVSIIGAFFAAPLGVVFGALYALTLGGLRALAVRPSRSANDLAYIVLGLGWVALAGLSAWYLIEVHPAPLEWSSARQAPWSLLAVCALMVAAGAGAFGLGVVRSTWRRWLVARARRGALPGWAIVDAPPGAESDALPRLFSFRNEGELLMRRETAEGGPFRSGETATAVGRI